MLRFSIITLFPEVFDAYFNASILKRAQEKKIISIQTHNFREEAKDKHKTVDDKPYGGGAGMLLMPEPILKTATVVLKKSKAKTKIIVFSAKGKQFTQKLAESWVKQYQHIVFIDGRYEGVDERVKKALRGEEISIGPYVLNDGDIAAMVVVSAIARLVPGVIKEESLKEESHTTELLEYPQYTRPESFKYKNKTYRVPNVLLSGDHKKIAAWRKSKQKSAKHSN